MKVLVLGVRRLAGTAKATGKPFLMCNVFIALPVDVGGGGSVQSAGYGFEADEMDLAEDSIDQFSKLQFPCQVELRTEVRKVFGELRTVCLGVEASAAVRKVG